MSAGLEGAGNVLEAGNLFFLGAQVPDCVENRVGERENSPSTEAVAKSPMTTGMSLPPGFSRIFSTIL